MLESSALATPSAHEALSWVCSLSWRSYFETIIGIGEKYGNSTDSRMPFIQVPLVVTSDITVVNDHSKETDGGVVL